MLLSAVSASWLLDVCLAAILTWAAHSSVAIVLLIMSLATKGVVPADAAFALVLGANLGTAINPLVEGPGGRSGSKTASDRQSDRTHSGRCRDNKFSRTDQSFHDVDRADQRACGCRFPYAFQSWRRCRIAAASRTLRVAVAPLASGTNDPADPARPLYLDPAAKETPDRRARCGIPRSATTCRRARGNASRGERRTGEGRHDDCWLRPDGAKMCWIS